MVITMQANLYVVFEFALVEVRGTLFAADKDIFGADDAIFVADRFNLAFLFPKPGHNTIKRNSALTHHFELTTKNTLKKGSTNEKTFHGSVDFSLTLTLSQRQRELKRQ